MKRLWALIITAALLSGCGTNSTSSPTVAQQTATEETAQTSAVSASAIPQRITEITATAEETTANYLYITESSASVVLAEEPSQAEINKLSEIENISFTFVSDISLNFLKSLKKLKSLSLTYTKEVMPYPTEPSAAVVDLQAVSELNIKTLYINGGDGSLSINTDDIASESIECLEIHCLTVESGKKSFPNLKELSVSDDVFTENTPFAPFKNASRIYIDFISLTNSDMNSLFELENTEELTLYHINFPEIKSFASLRKLKRIYIYPHQNETEYSIDILKNLSSPEEIRCAFYMYDENETAVLTEWYPDCKITPIYG